MTGEIGEKPACVKTHLRNVVVIPEMVGSVIGIYNGKGKFHFEDIFFSRTNSNGTYRAEL